MKGSERVAGVVAPYPPVGEITGMTKRVNSVDFKPGRPYRIVAGSEDFTVSFYEVRREGNREEGEKLGKRGGRERGRSVT